MDNLDQHMNELNELKDLMNQLESFSSNEDFRVPTFDEFKIETKLSILIVFFFYYC